jgi:hypothetical protein
MKLKSKIQPFVAYKRKKMHFPGKDKYRLRVKGWKKIFQINGA